MKESYMAEEAAELLGITKSNFLFRCRSLGITSIGRGKGYAASDVLLVEKYKELPQTEKQIFRTNYRVYIPKDNGQKAGYQKRHPVGNAKYNEYRAFIKRYMDENDIKGPMSSLPSYNKIIYRCKEKGIKSYDQFLEEVIGNNVEINWKTGREKSEIKSTSELSRKIKMYGNVYDYMRFDPSCTFDDELIEKFYELKDERPLYDDRPIREIYKEAMLSLMYKYHFICNDQYFDYKVAGDMEFAEYFTNL